MTVRDSAQLAQLRTDRALAAAGKAGYQIRVSYDIEDPAWDAFLAETPGGHHVQTSLWAQLKALIGWRTARVVVTRDERIVAGAQMLIRPLPFAGAIGYVLKGPLIALDDPMLRKAVIEALHRVARGQRVQCLVVQPPDNGDVLARQLPDWGFRPSLLDALPAHAVLMDLTKDLDELLAQMKGKTRYNLRLGERKGITVREGTESDLPTFYQLLVATGQRQQFSIHPEEYFSEMWRLLGQYGYIKLFLAEYAGEAVAALLAIPFGDTVTFKRGAWSGCHGNRHPNEVMHWTVIKWAKAQGYRYYDFEGIDQRIATAIVQGDPLPDSPAQTVTSFKLGFGGEVKLTPGTYDYVYNSLLRWAYTTVYPKVANWTVVAKVEDGVRGIGQS